MISKSARTCKTGVASIDNTTIHTKTTKLEQTSQVAVVLPE